MYRPTNYGRRKHVTCVASLLCHAWLFGWAIEESHRGGHILTEPIQTDPNRPFGSVWIGFISKNIGFGLLDCKPTSLVWISIWKNFKWIQTDPI